MARCDSYHSFRLFIKLILIFSLVSKRCDAAWTLTGSSEFAVANEAFVLICTPDNNGVSIVWRRSGTTIAAIEYINRCVIQNQDPQYQYTCEPGPVYKLTIPANVMTNSQNDKVWRCESVFGGVGNDAEYTLKVAVPVSSVNIQGDSGYPAVNVLYENIPKTFTCITNGCRPKANVTVTTTSVTERQRVEGQSTQSDGLVVTMVSQTITASRGVGLKTIECYAVNIQGRPPVTSQTLTLDVYYIPSIEPTLSGYKNGTVLYEGDNSLTITCQQSGGYPLSVITWSCDGQTGTPNSNGTVASSYVQLTVNRNLNGKTCTCTVRHPHITTYTRTKSVTFTVYYPPTTPTVQTSGTSFPWVENTQGVLKCITTPGYPQNTTYDWLQNSLGINGQTTDTYTIPTLSNVHNGLRIQCRVSNLYMIQKPPAIVSNITILDVQYTPIITLDTTNITVQEGDNLSRPCSAIGNPRPTVKWYRGNIEQTSGTGTSATLVFSNIDRNQADTYQCKATATGKLNFKSSKSVSVVIYYPPAVTVSLQNSTENDTNAVLTCNAADGFPKNYTYHGWNQYIGSTIVRSYTDFSGMLSESNRKITISKVTFEDIGRYYCVVENGFHGRKQDVLQQGSSYFDVRASAKFDPKEEARKTGKLHENLIINITFYSNPLAVNNDIKWMNETSGNLLTNSDSILLNLKSTTVQRNIHGKNVTLHGQSAILTIASLKSFHLGHYELQIQNGEDLSSSFDFQIITSAPPEAPSAFSLAKNGTKSVILTWKGGFNGGYAQTFIIRYTNTVTRETKETTIEDTNQNSSYTKEIKELRPSTTYHFWIYSTNEEGNSNLSDTLIVQTLKELKPERENIGAIVGGVTGTLAAIIIVVIIGGVIIYRRRTHGTKRNNSRLNGKFPLTSRDQSDEEDGMRDNVLYEPAGPNFIKSGTSSGVTGGQNDYSYAEVQKNGKSGLDNPIPVYAEVQKNPKKDKNTHPSALYADVQKPKKEDKEGKGGAKPKKLLGKPKEKKAKPGTLYENMEDINSQKKDDEKKKPKGPRTKTKPNKNKDGLIYADILHESNQNGESRLVIHGLENKTDYAEVDFSRSGKPLPPDNSQPDKQEPPNK